ncbi:zinc-ribbon domain-containing protein, partial [Anaerolineae bacterium CFX7]|nr:zinc-ribbon domain-containing protein [Anaerolineae bacterium CFX7]
MLVCPHCSFQNLPTATFCANCGRDLTRPQFARDTDAPRRAPEAERRFVTILFADLSGFTALAETRDPEAVRELINACFDLLVPIIEEHQGVVDQFVGDAIVALFGAPAAHEDDPLQACRAAL